MKKVYPDAKTALVENLSKILELLAQIMIKCSLTSTACVTSVKSQK